VTLGEVPRIVTEHCGEVRLIYDIPANMTRHREFGSLYPDPLSRRLEDPEVFVAGGVIEVPWRVRVQGEWIVYERGDRERFERSPWAPKSVREAMDSKAMKKQGVWHYKAPSSKLLRNFIGLAESKNPQRAAAEVQVFAETNGVLHLCPLHRLPASHNPGPRDFDRNNLPSCRPYEAGTWQGRERIEDWLRFARLARRVRDIATRLHNGSPGRPEEWQDVCALVPTMHFDKGDLGHSVAEDWFHLRWLVNAWLSISTVTLTLREVGQSRLLMRFDSSKMWGQLFGALGMQLLLLISNSRGMAICSECGEPYEVRRTPDPTRDCFCSKHKHVALQRAKIRDRDAQREILRLSETGLGAAELARKLGTSVRRVRRVARIGRIT
jgi:hypothetical protein